MSIDMLTSLNTLAGKMTDPPSGAKEPDGDTIKMFVGQVPKSMAEDELLQLFQEFGPVYQLNVLRDKSTGVSRGCCFVTYFKRRHALDAQNSLHNVKILPGMHHPIQMKPADTENRNERKLFVGMVSKKLNEEDIKKLFQGFGPIEECTVLRDDNGVSRGCAFVTFSSRSVAASAIKSMHHSQTMEGCSSPLVVKFADTQKDKEQKKLQQLQTSLWSIANLPGGGTGLTPFGSALALANNNPNSSNNNNTASLLVGSPLTIGAAAAGTPGLAIANGHHHLSSGLYSHPLLTAAAVAGLPGSSPTTLSTSTAVAAAPVVSTSSSSSSSSSHLQQLMISQAAAAANAMAATNGAGGGNSLTAAAARAGGTVSPSLSSVLQPASDNLLGQAATGTHSTYLSSLLSAGAGLVSPQQAQLAAPSHPSGQLLVAAANSPQSQNGYSLPLLASLGFNSQMMSSQLPQLTSALSTNQAAAAAAVQAVGQTVNLQDQQLLQLQLSGITSVPTSGHLLSTSNNIPVSVGSGFLLGRDAASGLLNNGNPANNGFHHSLQEPVSSSVGALKTSHLHHEGPDGSNLFIYHLPPEFTDSDLHSAFTPFGSIISAKVFIDKQTNLSKCFGFVSFTTKESAQSAIQAMNGFQVGTKRLKVQLKRAREAGKPY